MGFFHAFAEALEKQRQEYEQRMQLLRNQIMSPGTPSNPFLNFNSFTPTGSGSQNTLQRKYQKWAEKRYKMKGILFHLWIINVQKKDLSFV